MSKAKSKKENQDIELDSEEVIQESEEIVQEQIVQTDCSHLEEKIKKTKEELKKVKAHSVELINQIQRLKIDVATIKQNNEKELERFKEKTKLDLAKNLLPVFDTLEIAAKTKGEDKAIKTGIENALKQIKSVFESLGLEIYGKEGDEFDPNYYEAVSSKPAEKDDQKDKVAEVLQVGLKTENQVLRPARVVVYS